MSEKLKMPWDIKQTITNMEHIRDTVLRSVRRVNLDGKAEDDVREVNFDFGRVKQALEKQIAKKPILEGDGYDNEGNMIYDTWICPNCDTHYEVEYDDYNYCPNCGQKLDLSDVNVK